MVSVLLIIHMLCAVALIGAITHQSLSVWWPVVAGQQRNFVASFRGVRSAAYAKPIIILYLLTALIGVVIYPSYRIGIRPILEQVHFNKPLGLFELKEHFIAIGFALLPVYWYLWRQPLTAEHATTRRIVTGLLMLIVWWGFLVGHILNNIRGFGL
jgi:hypothetical protein